MITEQEGTVIVQWFYSSEESHLEWERTLKDLGDKVRVVYDGDELGVYTFDSEVAWDVIRGVDQEGRDFCIGHDIEKLLGFYECETLEDLISQARYQSKLMSIAHGAESDSDFEEMWTNEFVFGEGFYE